MSLFGDIAQIGGTALTLASPFTGGMTAPVGMALSGVGAAMNYEPTTQTVQTTDPTTPYKVKLPSGAIITMWSHGKGTQTTTTNNPSALSQGVNQATQAYGMLYGQSKTPDPYTAGAGMLGTVGSPVDFGQNGTMYANVPGNPPTKNIWAK